MAQTRPPAAGPKAGNISALLPIAKITRGTGRTRSILEAKKGDEVVYNDLIQTEKGGRARITLNDQSILSLGSQAELRIVKHDARTQQTALQLTYGRVRAEVASVTRDGGRFELRTPTAVAGVIGTDFGTDSSIPGVTAFICISGIVQVSNADEKVPGTVPCPAGSTTTVNKGLPPTAPKPATQQQIQQLIQDTEPAIISGLSPASALLGSEVLSVASGSKMNGINAVSITGSGVTVALQGAVTETSANVKVNVDANAAPGTRTITFTKTNGQSTAAVFSILAPPKKGEGGTDLDALKKSYLEILEQERQSAITGVNALGIGVQQSAADAQQAIENENNKVQPPLDTSAIEKDITADIAAMVQAMQAAGGQINDNTGNATKQLEALFADAKKRADAANPPPSDDDKLKIAKDIFDRVNSPLLQSFKSIQDGLGGAAKTVNAKLLQTVARWLENLKIEAAKQKAVPIPKVDADERSYDVGLMAGFDAARSTASPGGSLTGFSWVLCDPNYKPQQVGVPLSATDTRCQPLAGYASNSSDFKFQTCQLNPQDYVARVTITDSNNKATKMDVRVRVLPPQYEPPGVRLRSLSDGYQQLQPNYFLSFFDESYSGLTELQESIRRTFSTLASMNINLRLSQAAIDCNEATVRADWDQSYTFKDDQTCANVPAGTLCQRVVFKQQEQLTVRMRRVPGKNWYITEFQGDNGTVQGTPPGPIQRDIALPDLEIKSLSPASLPAAGRENSVIGIAPGPNGFAAVVTNVGNADLSGSVKVRFVVRDGNGNEIGTDVRELQGPLAVGASATVVGQLTVPDLGPGVGARIFAGVNPGCVVVERNCDAANITLLEIIIGVVDLQITGFSPVGTLVGTQPGQINVNIKNLGSRASLATTGNLRLFLGTTALAVADIPSIAPGATAAVPVTFTAPNISGTQLVNLVIAPATAGEINPANDNFSGTLTFAAPLVDLKASSLAISSAAPYLSGQTINVTLNVQNTGNRSSAASDVLACRLANATAGTQSFAPIGLAPVAAGTTVTGLTYSFVLPVNLAGSNTLTCGVSQDPFEPPGNIGDNTVNIGMNVSLNVDLQLVNLPSATGTDQMGAASSVSVGVKNFGLDTAPAGWNLVLRINNAQLGNFVSTAPLASLATLPVTFNYTTPQVASAPADVTVPGSLQVNANNAIQETNTGNNTFSATLRLVDFTIQRNFPQVSGVVGRPFSLAGATSVLPNPYPISVSVSYSGLPAGIAPSGTSNPVLFGSLTAVGSSTVGAAGTADGVTHNMASPMIVDSFAEIAMSLGTAFALTGGGAPQPFQVNVTGGIYPVTLNLILPSGVTIASGATNPIVLNGPGSVTWNLVADTSVAGGTALTDIVVHATDGGSAAVPAGSAFFAPPYNRTRASYDLEVTSVTATSANFAGRNFATNPLLSGEAGDFSVTVRNNGPGPSTAGVPLRARLLSEVIVSPATPDLIPALGSGASVTLNVHVRMADPTFTNTTSLDFRAETTDGFDSNTLNNTLGVPVSLSDWSLAVSGPGGLAGPLDIAVPSPASGNTNLQINLTNTGSVLTPIDLVQGIVSSFMTAVVPANITTTQPVTISASTTPLTPGGAYAVQVIAKMKDGATVTAQRSVTIHTTVNGGTPADTVTLTTNVSNDSPGNATSCVNPCVPLQVDGLLVETVALTASRSGGTSGSTDLIFSDVGNVVSNVTASGAPLVQQLTAVPYATPVNVNFGALELSGGAITTGITGSVISATAVTTAARGGPVLDTVGTQQTTLHFNIGDINVTYPVCIGFGPGATRTYTFTWSAVSGFNKTLNLQWTSTGGYNVAVPTSIPPVPAPYAATDFTFTNNETTEGGPTTFVLAATISNGNGSATKFFNIPVNTTSTACPSAGRGGNAANLDLYAGQPSYWKRGGIGSTSSAGRATMQAIRVASGTPDLQIKPVDVSVSPSLPQPGDTLDVRFKVSNAGDATATNVPIVLQVNGASVATESYTLNAGATTLGGFQYQLPTSESAGSQSSAQVQPARYQRGAGIAMLDDDSRGRRLHAGTKMGVSAQLVIDPAGTVKQKSTAYKTVALTKSGLVPVDGAGVVAAERVYLEMNTICSGFRISSGAVVDCDGGADLDIAIEDFKASRFSLNAMLGVADLGIVEPNVANATGAQFAPRAALVLGHTYAVQMVAGKVGYVRFSASLTPRQLEAEAKRRFGLNGVRILRKLGADTGSTGAGDVSGRISADALMYFDMTFRP